MSSLVEGLNPEVAEFLAECRAKTYAMGAEPNYKPRNPKYKVGFSYTHDGITLVDVSTEQDGIFDGEETMYISGGKFRGKKIYSCHYTGGNTEIAELFPNRLVDRVQHGLVIAHPRLVRAGENSPLTLDTAEDGRKFRYYETGFGYRGGRTNREGLSVYDGPGRFVPVYEGSHQFTVYPRPV